MNTERLRTLLTHIARGTHDPYPTRRMPPIDNKVAWEIDSWWQDYFTSNDKSLRGLAIDALKILDGIEESK